MPNWVGTGIEWPVYEEFPGSYLGPAAPVWFAEYPRQMSMPWIDIYDASRRVGVTLADLDERPSGAISAWFSPNCSLARPGGVAGSAGQPGSRRARNRWR